MKHLKFLVLFAFLPGCNGGEFSTAFTATDAPDSGAGGAQATGGASGTGGSTGGVIGTGGAPEVDAGGTPSATGGAPASTGGSVAATGGTVATGGVVGTGGAPVADACALVTHDNGLGQTWQDCVPLDTYNAEQALKACEASGAVRCFDNGLSSGACGAAGVVDGFDVDHKYVGRWTYTGIQAGFVSADAGCPQYTSDSAWS